MRLYLVKIPPTYEQGSHVMRFMCNRSEVRKEALAEYNDSRSRDGFPPLTRLPAGATVDLAIKGA